MLDAGTCRDAAEGGATDRMMTRLAAANPNELGGDAAAIRPRWDTDTRGRGIGDGRWIAPAVQHLLAALAAPGWIAEEPDVHLLPHLRQACEAPNSPWTLIAADLQEAVYVVTLEWSRPQPRLHQLRADAVALIGRVAEGATFVQQRTTEREIEYHVTTGMLEGDSPFAGHGHLLLLRIGGPPITQMINAMK
jgi:hypothetical protein